VDSPVGIKEGFLTTGSAVFILSIRDEYFEGGALEGVCLELLLACVGPLLNR